MTNPPRRKRFQIHLSTAVVMMFVAGALIWANVRPVIVTITERKYARTRVMEPGTEYTIELIQPGFPIFVNRYRRSVGNNYQKEVIASEVKEFKDNRFSKQFLVPNALASALILLIVWFLCEWLIRRRAARKAQ